MSLRFDPENNETRALLSMTGALDGKCVLEIGCGDGRLTWRYAVSAVGNNAAAKVVGIDPNAEKLRCAQKSTPVKLRPRVTFFPLGLEQFAAQRPDDPLRAHMGPSFDLAILAWSL